MLTVAPCARHAGADAQSADDDTASISKKLGTRAPRTDEETAVCAGPRTRPIATLTGMRAPRSRARAALHAKAPVMLSLSLPNCAESPQGHALVKAEVARHLTQMITALQEAAADTMPT